jgi:hypothetical protein
MPTPRRRSEFLAFPPLSHAIRRAVRIQDTRPSRRAISFQPLLETERMCVILTQACRHESPFRLFPVRSLGARVARFRRMNEDKPYRHHDALELPSGQVVLLTSLCEGQRATVIQLPVTERQPAQQASPSVVA